MAIDAKATATALTAEVAIRWYVGVIGNIRVAEEAAPGEAPRPDAPPATDEAQPRPGGAIMPSTQS
jgi:hypothetical protein